MATISLISLQTVTGRRRSAVSAKVIAARAGRGHQASWGVPLSKEVRDAARSPGPSAARVCASTARSS